MLDTLRVAPLNPVDAWGISKAVDLHFKEGKFDAVKYKFKAGKCTRSTFEALGTRKYAFISASDKLQTNKEFAFYCIANKMEKGVSTQIRDYDMKAYAAWMCKCQNLRYTFKSEMERIKEVMDKTGLGFMDLFVPQWGDSRMKTPMIWSLDVDREVLMVLNELTSFGEEQLKVVEDPFGRIQDKIHILEQYTKIFKGSIDVPAYVKIFQEVFDK